MKTAFGDLQVILTVRAERLGLFIKVEEVLIEDRSTLCAPPAFWKPNICVC